MMPSAFNKEENPMNDKNIFIEHVINAILVIRKNSKRPDNNSVFQYIYDNIHTNINQEYNDELLTFMIDRNLIYNKPTSKGSSYFITKQPIIKKIYDEESPQITIPETQENEIFISSPQFPTSDDPIKIDDKQVKQDTFISLRKEFEEFKVSVSKNFEKVKYMEQLHEDNKNKNLIIKILLENITSLTDTIKKYSQPIKKDNTNENNKNPHDNLLESLNVEDL